MINKYDKAYYFNTFSLCLHKSNRKNSICSDVINVNHLINHETDNKIPDEKILMQFVGTLETVIYYSLKYQKHLEVSCYVKTGKNINYINANHAIYHGREYMVYSWARVQFSSIEEVIDFLYSVYCLIYPYSELSLSNTVYNHPSIKHLIDKYYQNTLD